VQLHKCACLVCDEDATGELRVRTVRYFKGLEKVHMELLGHGSATPRIGSVANSASSEDASVAAPSAAGQPRQNHLDQDFAMHVAAQASKPGRSASSVGAGGEVCANCKCHVAAK